jgi:hypothetical protein
LARPLWRTSRPAQTTRSQSATRSSDSSIKAPGKGADPRRFDDAHDKDQWSKLKSLPNLLYTDGNSFSLWQDGEIAGTGSS